MSEQIVECKDKNMVILFGGDLNVRDNEVKPFNGELIFTYNVLNGL